MSHLLATHSIVHVNASLNATATVLLVIGLGLIKKGRVEAHKRTMLAAFAVSIAFLGCYLWKITHFGHDKFTHLGPIHDVYVAILGSHVLLAMTVPFLAARQIYLGYCALGCCGQEVHQAEQLAAAAAWREKHRRLARVTFPIWLYVSVTGVVVYVMLYHLWPAIPQ